MCKPGLFKIDCHHNFIVSTSSSVRSFPSFLNTPVCENAKAGGVGLFSAVVSESSRDDVSH